MNGGCLGDRLSGSGGASSPREVQAGRRARVCLGLGADRVRQLGLFGQQRAPCSLVSDPPREAPLRAAKTCAHTRPHSLSPLYTALRIDPEGCVFSA